MNQAQRDAIINLLKEYEHLIAENQALKAILDEVEERGPLRNTNWRGALDHEMNSQAREAYREKFAPLLSEIDSAFRDSELSQLLLKMPINGPIN
jgi:hypothetical protein